MYLTEFYKGATIFINKCSLYDKKIKKLANYSLAKKEEKTKTIPSYPYLSEYDDRYSKYARKTYKNIHGI